MQYVWSYFYNSIFWSDFKKKLIENATVFDYITILKSNAQIQWWAFIYSLWEKSVYLIQLLIMFTDINISTTLVGLYILTSAMTTGRAISSKEVKYPMRRVDKRSSNYCITRSIFTTLYIWSHSFFFISCVLIF